MAKRAVAGSRVIRGQPYAASPRHLPIVNPISTLKMFKSNGATPCVLCSSANRVRSNMQPSQLHHQYHGHLVGIMAPPDPPPSARATHGVLPALPHNVLWREARSCVERQPHILNVPQDKDEATTVDHGPVGWGGTGSIERDAAARHAPLRSLTAVPLDIFLTVA